MKIYRKEGVIPCWSGTCGSALDVFHNHLGINIQNLGPRPADSGLPVWEWSRGIRILHKLGGSLVA